MLTFIAESDPWKRFNHNTNLKLHTQTSEASEATTQEPRLSLSTMALWPLNETLCSCSRIIKAEPFVFLNTLLQMIISSASYMFMCLEWKYSMRKRTEKPNYVNESLVPTVPIGRHAKRDELLSELTFNFEGTHKERLAAASIRLFSNFVSFSGELEAVTVIYSIKVKMPPV